VRLVTGITTAMEAAVFMPTISRGITHTQVNGKLKVGPPQVMGMRELVMKRGPLIMVSIIAFVTFKKEKNENFSYCFLIAISTKFFCSFNRRITYAF
jgi:hypothetical protein